MSFIRFRFVCSVSLFLLLSGTIACERNASRGLPVASKDPVAEVGMLEAHSEALARWAAMGIRNAVVINIDAHDDFRVMSDEAVWKLRSVYESGDNNALAEGDMFKGGELYNVGNFLYAAARLGIVDEVYWVIPFAHYSNPDKEERLKRFLLSFHFSQADVATFSMQGGCFKGLRGGMRLSVCGMESLPVVTGPVVLSIDVDNFAPMLFEYGIDHMKALKWTMDSIARRGYSVRDVVVSYSVSGGYTRPVHLWVGDAAVRFLRQPRLLSRPQPPEDMAMLQGLELMRRAGRFMEMADAVNKPSRIGMKGPQADGMGSQPEFLAYAAEAYYAQDRQEMALLSAESACMKDSLYCYVFPYIGGKLLKKKDIEGATVFFERGFELSPRMNLNLLDYAVALMDAGRLDESLVYIGKYQGYYGRNILDFIAGQIYLAMGDDRRALECFDNAYVYMTTSGYGRIKRAEVARAALVAADLYEQRDETDKAGWLRAHHDIISLTRGR